jgi:hypothetical protein
MTASITPAKNPNAGITQVCKACRAALLVLVFDLRLFKTSHGIVLLVLIMRT